VTTQSLHSSIDIWKYYVRPSSLNGIRDGVGNSHAENGSDNDDGSSETHACRWMCEDV
jgi:hypothetical protein